MAILLHLTELCVCLPFHSVCEGVDGGVGRGFVLEGGRGRAPIVCVCVCVRARARRGLRVCLCVCVWTPVGRGVPPAILEQSQVLAGP